MLEAGEVTVGILDNNLQLEVVEKRAMGYRRIASKSKQTCKYDSGKRTNKYKLIHWPWLREDLDQIRPSCCKFVVYPILS